MAEQKLIFSATTPDGLDASKTISNFNPDASNAQLAQLGQKLIAFTDNTYGKTDRVIKYNCDTESGGSKLTPNLSLSTTSASIANLTTSANGSVPYTITTDSDGALSVGFEDVADAAVVTITYANGNHYLGVFKRTTAASDSIVPQTVTIYQAETNTYKAASVTFTITA